MKYIVLFVYLLASPTPLVYSFTTGSHLSASPYNVQGTGYCEGSTCAFTKKREAKQQLVPSVRMNGRLSSNDGKLSRTGISSPLFATVLATWLVFNTLPPFLFSEGSDAVASTTSTVIGEIKGSGLVFKDTLTVESFEDPKVQGVTLYVTSFQRPITERLSKNFFSDPSDSSVGCAKTGPVRVADNIATGISGEEVFEESRSLLFKSLRVQRLYDTEKNTMVYVSYNTRLDKNSDDNKSRFKASICAVNLDN